jgi:protein-disulfide isomerase
MNNQPKPKSGAPLIIIGAAALIIILVVVFYLQSSKTTPSGNANKAPVANAPKTTVDLSKAPVGAQPPNMKGGPNATVTIEEFADFQCPTCAGVYTIMNQVHAAYGSRIKFIYRNFPLTQIHKNTFDASVAAEAAYLQDQNKFWDMQNQLFTNQNAWANLPDPRPTFRGYAEKIGLDVAKWENDVIGMLAKNRVEADMARGKALNIGGTPTIYINGQQLTNQQLNFEAIKAVIDAELAKAPAQTSAPAAAQPAKPANANSK